MAGSVNKVILLGNLGRDPEVRNFPNGGKVANFSIATSENWKDRNTGERRERTEWHNVSITNEALVRVAEQYLKKGSKVYVEGQLETRKWQDQAGNDRYTTEVVLRPYRGELTMLDSRNSSSDLQGSNYSQLQNTSQNSDFSNSDQENFSSNDLDDEIPEFIEKKVKSNRRSSHLANCSKDVPLCYFATGAVAGSQLCCAVGYNFNIF